MHQVDISTEAILAIESAAKWYEDQRVGLGSEFLDDFEEAVMRIQKWHHLYPFFNSP